MRLVDVEERGAHARGRGVSPALSLSLVATFCGGLGAYAMYGVATSDSPWTEVLFTLLMQFEPPWFDIGDSAARVVSALAFWLLAIVFLVILVAVARAATKPPRQ